MSFIGNDKEETDDFLKNLNKKRDEKKELKEYTQYRKQCAIEKIKNILHLSFIDSYDTRDLVVEQRLVVLQLMKRIGECEEEIPKKFWCNNCKKIDKRIKELIKRFQTKKKYWKTDTFGKNF